MKYIDIKSCIQDVTLSISNILMSTFSIVILYSLVYILVFYKFLFNRGMPVGNDWNFPVFAYQLNNWLDFGLNTWSDQTGNIFGQKISFSVAIIFQLIGSFFSSIFGWDGEIYLRLLFLFSFLLGGVSAYALFLRLGSKKTFAFLGGLIFTLNPLTFNFILMGWNLALISIFSLPLILLLFDKYLESKKIRFLILTGLVYGIFGFMDSQSIIHFPVFLSVYFFIKNKINFKSLIYFTKSMILIFTIAVGLQFSWILLLIFVYDPIIASKVILNDVTRFALRFSYLNIIRGWGSVFNYQFEYAYPTQLYFFSFLPAFLLCLSLLFKKIKNQSYFFVFLFFYPFIMYLFSQHLSMYIPYTNVIRDFGRSFPYYFFAFAYFISIIKSNNKLIKYLVITLLLIFFFPFINDALYSVNDSNATGISTHGFDQRLRLYKFNNDIAEIDNYISDKKFDKKGLIVPTGGPFIIPSDKRFDGMWAAFWDYPFMFSNRLKNPMYTGYTSGYMRLFFDTYQKSFSGTCYEDDNISVFLQNLVNNNFFYIVLRNNVTSNLYGLSSDNIENCLLETKKIILVKEYIDFKLYEIKLDSFLPRFYTPRKIIVSNDSIEQLPLIVSKEDFQIRSVIFFLNQNIINTENIHNLPSEIKRTPILEFKKINPTKYRIRIHNASDSFPLVFSESFHDGWKAYLVKSKETKINLSILDKYKILDENQDNQATKEELIQYINNRWIMTIGDNKEKEIEHKKWENNKELLDYTEKYNINFISKNYQDSIQNDNLPNGKIYETWFMKPIENNENHLLTNGYANSWIIDPTKLCNQNNKCIQNANGSYDFELVVEFWPQRIFLLGLVISVITFFACTGYLIYDWLRNKNSILKKIKGV